MMRRMRLLVGNGVRQPNFQAIGVAFATMVAVNLNTDPLPAGSEPLALSEAAVEIPMTVTPTLITPKVNLTNPAPLADGLEPKGPIIQPVAATTEANVPTNGSVSNAAPAASAPQGNILTGKWAMQMNVLLLQKGLAQFSKIPDYQCNFTKQERIGGDLSKVQQISLKMRHEPLSIYMKWRSGETGQQVIYVEGQNDGKMLVKAGGLKGRLGTLSLDPNSALAMSQSRHPVMMVGLKVAAEQILKYQVAALDRGSGFQCELREDAEFDGRPCYLCLCSYDTAEISPEYRKSEILIDKQYSMPVSVRNFTWGADPTSATLDEDTLIEHYMYTEIQLQQQFADLDFSRQNEDYRMTR